MKAIQAGMNDYLTKPFEGLSLVEKNGEIHQSLVV